MQKVCRGLIDVIAGGRSMTGFSDAFNEIGQGTLFDIPYTIFYALVFLILAVIFTKRTVCGRIFIAIGGNREGYAPVRNQRSSAIRSSSTSSARCWRGLSGIMLASRLGSAQPTAGTSQDLNVVAACILGGNSLAGGVATMVGTLVGVAIMATITVALTMMRVSAYWAERVRRRYPYHRRLHG